MESVSLSTRKQSSLVNGRQVLLTFIAWIVSSAVISTATYVGLHTFAPEWQSPNGPTVVIVAEVYFLFLASVFVVFGGWSGLRDKLNFRLTSRGDLLLALGVYLVTLSAGVLLYWAVSPVLGPLPNTLFEILRDASDMSRLASADLVVWVFIIVRACIFAPLVEELLFRGLLFGWLRSRFSASLTILLTAILFMFIHFYPILFPFAFLFGVTSGWVRERTGSSLTMVIAHFANSVLFLTTAYILVTRYGM